MEFPEVLSFETTDSEQEAASELARHIEGLGVSAPFVVTSPHGDGVSTAIKGVASPVTPPPAADQRWASELGSTIHRSGADVIVAIG